MRYENQSPTFMNCCGAASVQVQLEAKVVAAADAATSNVQHFSQRLPRNHKTSPLAPHKIKRNETKAKIRARHTRRLKLW